MIDRVAQQVRQRTFQSLQDVAVHLGVFADDFEAHLLAQGAGQVAHHARKAADAIAEGPHARAQHFQIHALRKVGRAAVEHVQLLHPVGQKLLAFGHFAAQLVKLMFRALGQVLFAQPVAQVIQLVGQLGLVAFEALERVGKRAQPARFDQRLARQPQQAIEILGRQPHHPFRRLRAGAGRSPVSMPPGLPEP